MRRGRKVGVEWNDRMIDGWNPLVNIWHRKEKKGKEGGAEGGQKGEIIQKGSVWGVPPAP